MAERLATKPGAGTVPVTIGDMTSTRVPGTIRLVYLVANTITTVTPQTIGWRSSATRPRTGSSQVLRGRG